MYDVSRKNDYALTELKFPRLVDIVDLVAVDRHS